jgi:DeoR family glycerol-3-phosphate regulon repressor
MLDALRRLGGSARSSDLAKTLDVSEETVRRTIKALSKMGMVQRVHGGAYLAGTKSDPSFFQRISQHSAEKKAIARLAASRFRNGMTVFLDVGSTTAFVAEEARAFSGMTVVTNSIGVAQTLVGHNGNRVHLLGGEVQGDERGTFGFTAEQQIRRFAIDLAVLSADACSPKHALLYANSGEAQLAAVVAECAEYTLATLAHPKFDETAPYRGPDPRRLDELATDRQPGKKMLTALQGWGVTLSLTK